MNRKNWIFAAGAMALAALTWNLLDASGEAAAPAAPGDRLEALESRVAGLSQQTRTTQLRMRHLADRADTPKAPPPGTVADEEVPADESEDDGVEPVPLEFALEQSFEIGAPDIEWTQTAPGEVRDALVDLLPDGSWLHGVECRGSLCRAEIRHDAEGGHAAFVESLLQSPRRWTGPGSYDRVLDVSGEETTVAYLGRPGSDEEEGSIWRVASP